MAEGKRYTITNTAAGPRGVHQDDGSYAELAPGETRSVDLTDAEHKSAVATGYFTFGGKSVAAGVAGQGAIGGNLDRDGSGAAGGSLPRNVMQLKKIARDEGIDIGSATGVDALQAVILAARTAKAQAAGAGGGTGTTPPTDDLASLDDDTLRATTAALTGKPVGELPTDRESLLELARGVK